MTIKTTKTVGELALTIPGATGVFEKLGIDYCCGGDRTLDEACLGANLSVEVVSLELEKAAAQTGAAPRDWRSETLTSLAAHIIDTHHFFTKQELARLEALLEKVLGKHGENHPELFEVWKLFLRLKQDLIPHMLKEEQVLFPFVARMEEAVTGNRPVPQPFFGTVRNPVSAMMAEHDTAGDLLKQLRSATGGYVAPPDGCASYQTLYQSLAGFEADLHQHIHLENNILFPRAVGMETSSVQGPRQTAAG
jgi:regulator of cell morphogenesis and NO signaling